MDIFSDWFRDTIQRKGQTYEQAAFALDVSLSTCWQWSKGRRTPKVGKLIAISQWGGTTVARLVGAIEKQNEAVEAAKKAAPRAEAAS
ncbi:MAG: helix-turn-helix transcriptional regulator [bacterium]|nr:helix-turn-helix transcriptional regulator [bacterium]